MPVEPETLPLADSGAKKPEQMGFDMTDSNEDFMAEQEAATDDDEPAPGDHFGDAEEPDEDFF